MKICLINNLYKPYNRGGAERVVELMAEEFKTAGHEIFIISTCPDKTHQENNNYYLKSLYYNLNKLVLPLRLGWQIFNLFNLNKYSAVKKILKTEKPDLVITNNLMGLGFLIPSLIKKLKLKHIHIIHDIQLLHPSGLMIHGKEKIISSLPAKIYQTLNKILFNSPTLIVSPSKWLLELHKTKNFFPRSKKIVLKNPIALGEKFKNQNNNFKNFLYVGQIEEAKGIMLLIKAFNKFNNGKLIIVGDGSKLEMAKKIAGNQIEFLGKKNSSEIKDLMRSSSCLIVPSLCYENSPTVIYEALNNDLMVLGSNHSGIVELIDEYGGLLYTPNNESDLIINLNNIYHNFSQTKNHVFKKDMAKDNYIQRLLSETL